MVRHSKMITDKKAREIAIRRVDVARRYAAMFPHLVNASDKKYQDMEWQYEHEGLPSVRRPESHFEP